MHTLLMKNLPCQLSSINHFNFAAVCIFKILLNFNGNLEIKLPTFKPKNIARAVKNADKKHYRFSAKDEALLRSQS